MFGLLAFGSEGNFWTNGLRSKDIVRITLTDQVAVVRMATAGMETVIQVLTDHTTQPEARHLLMAAHLGTAPTF
jgi:hypothetical protein